MTATDGDAPAMAATDCWSKWLDGPLALAAPQPLPNQSEPSAIERDPWVSRDGLRLYYARDLNGAGKSQIFLANRARVDQPFGAGAAVPNVNDQNKSQDGVSLTEDELILILSSDRAIAGNQFDYYLSSRGAGGDTFGTGDQRFLGNLEQPGAQHFDPSLTADGMKLYLAPDPPGGVQHILLSTRATRGDSFGDPQPVPVINDATSADADPAVSRDERVIVFSSGRPTGLPGNAKGNLWYAVRHDPGADFDRPHPIPGVSSDQEDGDPRLSDDGCTLYFSSNRAGPTRDLFSATVTP